MFVGNPAAGRPAVIEIEHRGDRIDAQTVDAVSVKPEQSAGEQEIRDFGAAEIVDQRVPVQMPALFGLGMLVNGGPVEAAEAVRIVGKVSRNPIQQDAKAGAVAGIDQVREIGRAAEAAGRREHSGRLITPGAVERMFAHRQEFEMGEAEVACA